jgi:hypothetical protein
MRTVTWTDADGYKHRSILRDSDPDEMAPFGISQDPPDLRRISWDDVRRDVHNAFLDAGIVDWESYQRHDVRGILLHAIQRRVQALYREVEND